MAIKPSDSILLAVRKACLASDDFSDYFDKDLIPITNSVFAILLQVGIGPRTGFIIEDETATWQEFFDSCDDPCNPMLGMVKPYVTTKTRLLFDPPQNTSVLEALKQACAEYEWRLNIAVDP